MPHPKLEDMEMSTAPKPSAASVRAEVEAVIARAGGSWRIAARLGGDALFSREPRTVVPAASTVKTAILLAALEQIDRDALEPDLSLELPRVRTGGSGVLSHLPGVERLSVTELLTLMVAVSDNTATNLLIDTLGFDAVNECARELGARDTLLARRMMDANAAAEGRENTTTARDQTIILEALAGGRTLSRRSTAAARAMLAVRQSGDGMPSLLPSRTRVLRKAGELPGVRHDVGVVALPDGRELALAVLGSDLSSADSHSSGDTIARLTRVLVAWASTAGPGAPD